VFEAGGFDVVIGNPPYVRQELIKEDKPFLQQHYQTFDGIADLYVYFYELGISILKPGGRMEFISSNSFLRAAYAQELRTFLATRVGTKKVIDLGDTQIFADAKDVYPVIVIAAKAEPEPTDQIEAYRFRRNDPVDDISETVQQNTLRVSLGDLSPDGWRFENRELSALREKINGIGRTLGIVAGGQIYRGLISGLNDAFVVPTGLKNELCKSGNSQEILKPFVGGQHVQRWLIEDSGNWLILFPYGITAAKSGVSDPVTAREWLRKTYPAIEAHLSPHEMAAKKRTDKGQFWWELRSCDYYSMFDEPKIIYPDIAKSCHFAMDKGGTYSNNTTYLIPSADFFLLGVLNSKTTWFSLSGLSVPFGERAGEFRYRLFTQYMTNIPIPEASDADQKSVSKLAEGCSEYCQRRYQVEIAVQQRLTQAFGTDTKGNLLGKLNEKAQEWWAQPFTQLGSALKASFKLPSNPFTNPKIADQWEPYIKERQGEVAKLNSQVGDSEAELNERVCRLFDLTPEEIKILQAEVDPRPLN
jgi:hypothetical protein